MKKRKFRDLLFKKNFYERLIKLKPDYMEALIQLANIYTSLGNYKKSLQIDLKVAHLSPLNPLSYYNLACDYSLLGDIDKAIANIKIAISLGYRDINYMEKDPDLENLRKDKRYKEIKKLMKK